MVQWLSQSLTHHYLKLLARLGSCLDAQKIPHFIVFYFHHPLLTTPQVKNTFTTQYRELPQHEEKNKTRAQGAIPHPESPSKRPQRRPKPIIILCLFQPRKRSKPLRVEGGLVRHQQKKHHQQDGDAPRRTPGPASCSVAVGPEWPQGEPAAC